MCSFKLDVSDEADLPDPREIVSLPVCRPGKPGSDQWAVSSFLMRRR